MLLFCNRHLSGLAVQILLVHPLSCSFRWLSASLPVRFIKSIHGVGNIVNVPLIPNSGSVEFRQAYENLILPALREFKPDFLMISAGFDAHARDPLCQLNLATEDFAWITKELMGVANECCDGKVVSTLEGGYDMQALSDSVAAHVRVLMNYV